MADVAHIIDQVNASSDFGELLDFMFHDVFAFGLDTPESDAIIEAVADRLSELGITNIGVGSMQVAHHPDVPESDN